MYIICIAICTSIEYLYVYTHTYINVSMYKGGNQPDMIAEAIAVFIGPPVYQCSEHWSGGPGSLVRGTK